MVLACDASGKELGEIGVAHCSLEQLISDGKDQQGTLSIVSSEAAVGEISCTIAAVAALTPVATAKGRAPIARLASKLASKTAVSMGATALTLTEKQTKSKKVKLLLRLGGQPTLEPLASSASTLKADGTAAFTLTHSLKPTAGSDLTKALLVAIDGPPLKPTVPLTFSQQQHGREGTLRFELHAADAKDTAPLAVGALSLGSLLDANKDHSGKIDLVDPASVSAKPGPRDVLGALTCTCTAVKAMMNLEEQLDAARTAEAKNPSGGAGGSKAAQIVVTMTALKLTGKPYSRGSHSVRVEIDMPGDDDVGNARFVDDRISYGSAALKSSEPYDVSEGTTLQKALLDALASPQKDDGEIQFAVLVVDAKDSSKRTEVRARATPPLFPFRS